MRPSQPRIATNGATTISTTPAGRRRGTRGIPVAGLASLAAALALTAIAPVRAEGAGPLAGLLARERPVVCQNQTYALCAGASCFVFNDVAYCACNIRKGDSVSSSFKYAGGDICAVNAQGADNGFMASTFSLPTSLIAPAGKQALYKCPRTSRAAYAKCDGGLCFTSTRGQSVPGSGTPLGRSQIVCSCPVETANPVQGLEIIGPYPCQASFFKYCDPAYATGETGSALIDGTAIGSTLLGTRVLYGHVPRLNTCP